MDTNWDKLREECIDFTQRLIQTPSMSFEESTIADLAADEMKKLGFSEVWKDKIGNVNGRIPGEDRSSGTLVLNSHLDHVDPGDLSLWTAPPYSGEIVDGRIFGRGACDVKVAIAVQIYAIAALIRTGTIPKRDVVFSGVVQEEIGGAGAKYWVDHLDYPVELVVLGEPSSNGLSLGHRGIYQLWVKFSGRSSHASVPGENNPNYALASFIKRLNEEKSELSSHPLLGQTTVAPTLIEVDTKSMNVTPAWSRVLLDFRSASESPDSLHEFVRRIAASSDPVLLPAISEPDGGELPTSNENLFGYYTPPENPIVDRVLGLVSEGMGWEPELSSYRFATDGRFFEPMGIDVIGYSPGEERLAHTSQESISITMLADALRGYVSLLQDF